MLNSWFGSKDHDKTNDAAVHSDSHLNTSATKKADEAIQPANHAPPIGFISPHDAVLAQMRGEPHIESSVGVFFGEDIPGSKTQETHETGKPNEDVLQKEIVYEPFDGTPIGFITTSPPPSVVIPPQFTPTNQSTPTNLTNNVEGSKEQQWEHLSRVLDLQNELARMHLEMEGVGMGDGKGKTIGKGWARGKGKADSTSWENRNWGDPSDRKPKRHPTTDTIGADVHDGDEEGVDAAGNEEIEVKKAREEELSSMAEQFESRKESIHGIMSKLDQLSKALTGFHTLQAPTIEFPNTISRQNSKTPDASPLQIQPRTTPYISASLPNVGLYNSRPLRTTLPERSLRESTPQVMSDSIMDSSVLPASLARSGGKSPIGDMMEPGRHTDSPESMPLPLPTK